MPDRPDPGDGHLSRDDWERYEAELTGGTGGTPGRDPAAGTPPAGPGTPEDVGAWAAPARVLVDGPEAQRPARGSPRDATRRPLVPPWLKSPAALAGHARWALGLAAWTVAYQASRTPKYAARLAGRAPAGLSRVLRGWARWLLDLEGEPVRAAVVRREDADAYRHLSRQRDRRVRWRASVTAMLLGGLAAALVALALAPPGLRLLALALAVGVLGTLGQPADRPLLDVAVVVPQRPRLTSDMVTRALRAIGVTAITQALAKDPKAIEFVAPITRDGPGWRADIDLPLGVTPGDVVDKRPELASALRRRLGCVWPEGDPAVHEGRLVLYVGDRDLAQLRGEGMAWKLAKTGQHDIFTPLPFGVDARGRPIAVPMVQHNWLIGAMPRQGKTSSVVVLTSGAALDPTTELWLHELKGTGDLDAYEQVAHRFTSGIHDEAIGYAADSLALLKAEVMRRTPELKELPKEVCPDKRVTRQIADRRALGLHPLICVIDECQNLFAHSRYGGKDGGQPGADAEFVIRVGPAVGVILVLATQRPSKDALPTAVSGNVSIRFCLKVPGQVENDMILGTGAYKRGLNATLLRPELDAGIGYLLGATPTPTVACAAYLDVPARERVAARARALREAAGTLSGHALGQAPANPRQDETLLEDTLGVLPAGDDRIANEELRDRLAQARPGTYGEWSTERLAAALRDAGIDTRAAQVNRTGEDGERRNLRGIFRQSVVDALTQRGRKGGAG